MARYARKTIPFDRSLPRVDPSIGFFMIQEGTLMSILPSILRLLMVLRARFSMRGRSNSSIERDF
ncbi:hypothetical protein [Bradyrhizobium sp. BR 1432]|uniref:hypothetical protein n=1 Tax=Bradyrhizobium sp. BR 1432 TaxID=3447966 RepID=UPI003EE5A591